jgi:GNAT superfamily N-acetyltransferase
METIRGHRSQELRRFFPDYTWNYIADAILEGSMGKVLVDDEKNPGVVQLSLSEFKVSILGGDPTRPVARECLDELPSFSTLLFGMQEWKELLYEVHEGKVVTLQRYPFSSGKLDAEKLQAFTSQLPENFKIERMILQHARQILDEKGDLADGLLLGFTSPEDFIERGFGYCALEDGKIVCVATTGAVCSKGIEVQINTHRKYRKQGLASAAGAALILECLERGIDPNWDAATEISAGLAKKFGYIPRDEYEVYVYTGSRLLVNLRNFLRRIRGKEV